MFITMLKVTKMFTMELTLNAKEMC